MSPEQKLQDEIEVAGCAIRESVLAPSAVRELSVALERLDQSGQVRRRGSAFALRNLLEMSSEVLELAHSPGVRALIEPVLGPDCFPVRAILFDKIPGANWKVPWHQDVTIAVQERVEAEGFGPWSMKADVLHVQPPAYILEQMISVRLHLDPCGEANGALRVLPGSHRLGRIPEEEIAGIRERLPEKICAVDVGGALVIRPLLLHASSASQSPDHRRVVHLDFAAVKLPHPMAWFSEPRRRDLL